MKWLSALLFGFILTHCAPEQKSVLQRIQAGGELRVVTRYSPTTYYEGAQGAAGLEYDLVKRFADSLGVKLNVIVAEDVTDVFAWLGSQQVHLAAAGLGVNEANQVTVRYGAVYQTVSHQLLYRQDMPAPPARLSEFGSQHPVYVVAGSYQSALLTQLQSQLPQLQWVAVNDVETSELLEQVWDKRIGYALVDSNEVSYMRYFYPELRVAFALPTVEKLAWAFPRLAQDDSLYAAAVAFFGGLKQRGELDQLLERHYGHVDAEQFNFVDTRTFYQHVQARLPLYREHFERMANRYRLDWRLLAAISYQESHWNPNAVSMTGVRGLMMLTQATAGEMGVNRRENPFESIEGGAKYFVTLMERLKKETIPEPDKTWFILAAYNVGLGHLNDARQLTEEQGGDPNRWIDVKKQLPLLSHPEWYSRTQYGFARGYEPVQYVKNIRRYYEMMTRIDDKPELTKEREVIPDNRPFLAPLNRNVPIL